MARTKKKEADIIKEKEADEVSVGEAASEVFEKPEAVEKKSESEKTQMQELRKEVESMDLDDRLKKQAATQAQGIKSLKDEEKIKNLLEIAKKKGVIYAVHVAKQMNDPYILDALHDVLAEKGYYKKFIK